MSKPIRTDTEHEAAMKELGSLIDLHPHSQELTQEEKDRRDVLVILIEHYENKTVKIDPSDHVEAIAFRLEQQGVTQRNINEWTAWTRRLLGDES